MAELLRVTQPYINRNQVVNPQGKPLENPAVPFQVIDSGKIHTMASSKQTNEQNNTIILKDGDQPTILMNMLQDPQATVHFLRTIYLLQEVISMMPMEDNPISKEIEELFQNLILKPEEIVVEMINQENSATKFKGELFDNLRNMINIMMKIDKEQLGGAKAEVTNEALTNLLKDAGSILNGEKGIPQAKELPRFSALNAQGNASFDPLTGSDKGKYIDTLINALNSNENTNYSIFTAYGPLTSQLKNDIVALLKSMNQVVSREDILTSIGNNLSYLSTALKASSTLSENLKNLSNWFKYPDENFNFNKIQSHILELIKQVESSILFTPKIERNISILQYNLSRYNANDEVLTNAIDQMNKYFLSEGDQIKFKALVFDYINQITSQEGKISSSKVMNTLSTLIEKQFENSALSGLDASKIEKIIYSLLSSPTNYTPLLHFVVPVEFMDTQTFAEVWIDPVNEDEEESKKNNKGKNMQVLVAFDVGSLGRFEAELRVNSNKMSAMVFVPSEYYDLFKDIKDEIMRAVIKTKYQFESVEILPLERPRSLIEVFSKLPTRRTGINVKV